MAGRISGSYVDVDLFGAGKHGFRSGDPLAGPPLLPTRITKAWLNGMQEELIRSIELLGETPDPDDLEQLGTLLVAMKAKADGAIQGPASATTNAIPRFDGVTGKLAKNSGITITDSAELGYSATKTRFIVLGPTDFTFAATAWEHDDLNMRLRSLGNFGRATASLSFLPEGLEITAMIAIVDPGAARTGTDRMRIDHLRRSGMVFDAGSESAGSAAGLAFAFDNETASLQGLGWASTSQGIVKTNGFDVVRLSAGHDAATNIDTFYGLLIRYSDPGASFR